MPDWKTGMPHLRVRRSGRRAVPGQTLERGKGRNQVTASIKEQNCDRQINKIYRDQVLPGEERYDLVMRYLLQYRDTRDAISNIRLLSPTGERVSLAQLCDIEERDGASEIYREGNSRYIAIKYSVRGRDLGGAV